MVEIIDLNFCLLFFIYFRNQEFACSRTFIFLPFIILKKSLSRVIDSQSYFENKYVR